MIVWSRGLGKQRLPLELPDSTVHVLPDILSIEGVIEPVCWNYAIRLRPDDLADFLKVLSHPATVKLLAEQGGIFWPFVRGLVARLPGMLLTLISRKQPSKGDDDAVLV